MATTNTTKKTASTGTKTSTSKAKTTPVAPETSEPNDKYNALQEQYDDLKKQNEDLANRVDELLKALALQNTKPSEPVVINAPVNSLNDEVRIVHLVQRASGLKDIIHLTGLDVTMSEFGEERTLDRRQAEELVGKYRFLFDEGIIAFGSGNEELARRLAVKTVGDYKYMNSEFVRNLAEISARDLEDLYNKVCDGHKQFIIEYFKRKIVEKDPLFMDMSKIDVLNRLSGENAMFDVILDKQRDDMIAASTKK